MIMDIVFVVSQVTVIDFWCFHEYVRENYCFFSDQYHVVSEKLIPPYSGCENKLLGENRQIHKNRKMKLG
jgi:hypothetical protein